MATDLLDDDSLEQRAARRVKLKMGFYIHLLVFVLVNLGLWALRTLAGWERGWGPEHVHWGGLPLWGWGLGLTIHGIVTFVRLQGDGLQRRMLASEIEKLRRRGGR